eukprot:GDKJ01025136.1.p1 GENE.GDKJ01025136.1~~GDKJ01025136.1.p1  ORF type:complete len:1151 (+),score=257.15 GDKJ01025136.1:2-3454(+)
MAETMFADVALVHSGLSDLCVIKDKLSTIKLAVDKSSVDSPNAVFKNSSTIIRQCRSTATYVLNFVKQSEWLEGSSEDHSIEVAAKELLEAADEYYLPAYAGYELSTIEYSHLQQCVAKCEAALSHPASRNTGVAASANNLIRDLQKIRATPLSITNEPEHAWRDSITSLLTEMDNLLQILPPSSPIVAISDRAAGAEEGSDDEFPTSLPVVKNGRDAYTTILLSIETVKAIICKYVATNTSSRVLTAKDRIRLSGLIAKQIAVIESIHYFTLGWSERVSHFSMVISKLMIALMKKGFCKSEEEEEDNQNDDGDGGEGKEGTGMDDGKGEKDVTDEIENEDQLMNMKDKEQQENDQEDDGDDKDKAAEVETDFQAEKENRSDDEEDNEDDSDAEMGSVDEENQQERKKSRKEKDDPTMDEDEGGAAEEVPEDDLAQEKEKEEDGEEGDEETKDYGNKEKEIRDADSNADKDSENAELLGDNESQQFSEGDDDESAKSGDEKDAEDSDEDGEEKSVTSDIDDDGSGEGADEERQGSDEDEDKDPDRQEEADLDNPNAAEDGDAESTDEDADDKTDASKIKDQNSEYTGEQDDEAGEEKTDDKEKKTQKHDDNAGAENEEQTGNEQEKNDAGRSWKKKDQNEQSQKSSSDQKKQTNNANPMKALKEAMKRHTQKANQLNLDKQVKLKDDANDDNTAEDDQAVQSDDDFEIHEKGMDEGMAPTDESKPSVADAFLPEQQDKSDNEDEDDNAEPGEAPQDKRTKRNKEEQTEIEEGDSNDKESKKDKDKKKGKKLQLVAKEDEEDSDEPKVEELEAESLDAKAQRGRDLWYATEGIIAGHAQNLCEQLRLILAPTQADKLQGDYKTGKRINIKKIIPYIASQFKKDRIWLRRTKPNKRSYQVLIALDDSLSMSKNGADNVSFQAVALLSKAMQQLEVGEFGILRFGKEPTLAHPLDQPFAADSGPRVFSEFTFEQQSTSMRALLEYSLNYMDLEKSRLGSSIRSTTQSLRQMLFIVSDGQITEDRAALRKLLARAEENGQAVVLLILDIAAYDPSANESAVAQQAYAAAATEKNLSMAEKMRRQTAARETRLKTSLKGVLDMQVVEFQGTKVIKKAYLEDFPFPFYIVVQDIPSLPTILADSMRQWFELLANGQ